jgi:S1-C subfamily serine protease/Tfp pilus assembly protein PilF
MRLFRILGLMVLLGESLVARGQAGPEELPLQVFSSINRRVVAVGEPVLLEVEAWVTPASAEGIRPVEAALAALTPHPLPEGMELLRAESVVVTEHSLPQDRPVWMLRRRFVFRLHQPGEAVIPSMQLLVGTAAYATRPHVLQVYPLDPDFFALPRGIVPVAAEVRISLERGVEHRLQRIGTAFLVAPDRLLTSYHVVQDARQVHITLPDGRRHTLHQAWVLDPYHDVAVLYLDPETVARTGLRPLSLAPMPEAATPPSISPVVFTYGWPGGHQASTAGLSYPDVQLSPVQDFWVSNNPVRPGDSGGPLLDAAGQVLGVVTSGSVQYRKGVVLREDLCIATDPRPALALATRQPRPRPLRAFYRDRQLADDLHGQALRLMTRMGAGLPDLRQTRRDLAWFDQQLEQHAYPEPDLYFLQGMLYQMMGIMPDAVAAYETAIAHHEAHFPAAYMLARHYLGQRHYAEAERLFLQTARHLPYAHLADYGLAQTRMGQLRYAEARTLLETVLHHDPHFAPALYDLARVQMALGETARAWQLLVRLEQAHPGQAMLLRTMLQERVLHLVTIPEQPLASLRPLHVFR